MQACRQRLESDVDQLQREGAVEFDFCNARLPRGGEAVNGFVEFEGGAALFPFLSFFRMEDGE